MMPYRLTMVSNNLFIFAIYTRDMACSNAIITIVKNNSNAIASPAAHPAQPACSATRSVIISPPRTRPLLQALVLTLLPRLPTVIVELSAAHLSSFFFLTALRTISSAEAAGN
jgi:hypothetical protein